MTVGASVARLKTTTPDELISTSDLEGKRDTAGSTCWSNDEENPITTLTMYDTDEVSSVDCATAPNDGRATDDDALEKTPVSGDSSMKTGSDSLHFEVPKEESKEKGTDALNEHPDEEGTANRPR